MTVKLFSLVVFPMSRPFFNWYWAIQLRMFCVRVQIFISILSTEDIRHMAWRTYRWTDQHGWRHSSKNRRYTKFMRSLVHRWRHMYIEIGERMALLYVHCSMMDRAVTRPFASLWIRQCLNTYMFVIYIYA